MHGPANVYCMATLERREQTPGNVTYRVRWWANEKQRSKSFKRYDDAKRFKAVLEGDMVSGAFIDPKAGAVSLLSFIEEHADAIFVDVRASTRHRLLGIYRTHIVPEFGHLPLNAITTPMVNKWVVKMLETHSAGSVRKNVFALRRLLDLAVSFGILRANAAAKVRLPAESKNEQKFLTHDEALHLAECVPPRFRAMVLVAVFGGLRFGEIVSLQRKHILIERNQIKVMQTMTDISGQPVSFGPPKTKTSVRTVTIPRSVMNELAGHLSVYGVADADDFVFTGERGTVVRRAWFSRTYWMPAIEKAGMPDLRFHDLRHTFVAMWISLGRNAKEVSRAAGHSSVAFTLDRYGHLYHDDDDGLADELDMLLRAQDTLGHVVRPQLSASGLNVQVRAQTRPRTPPSHGGSDGSNPFGGTQVRSDI